MTYVVYWANGDREIVAVPEGSTYEDVILDKFPRVPSTLGSYGTMAETQRAIDEEKDRLRPRWT